MRIYNRAELILCPSAILVSAEWGCPSRKNVYPCTCTNYINRVLTCRNTYDTEVLYRVFKNARQYRFIVFYLEESNLQYIPHEVFDDVKVDEFYMTNVTLRLLFDKVPRDPGIWNIRAEGVLVKGGLDWKQLAVFKKLEILNITDMPLKRLTADFRRIAASKKISSLLLKNCIIKRLLDDEFAEFTNLEEFVFSGNPIADFKRTMFPRRNKITTITLEYNKISTLPSNMFSNMPFLKKIELKGNMLALLSEATFQPFISRWLTHLDVRENPIKCDCLIAWVLRGRRGVVEGTCCAPKSVRDMSFDHLTGRDIRC